MATAPQKFNKYSRGGAGVTVGGYYLEKKKLGILNAVHNQMLKYILISAFVENFSQYLTSGSFLFNGRTFTSSLLNSFENK